MSLQSEHFEQYGCDGRTEPRTMLSVKEEDPSSGIYHHLSL